MLGETRATHVQPPRSGSRYAPISIHVSLIVLPPIATGRTAPRARLALAGRVAFPWPAWGSRTLKFCVFLTTFRWTSLDSWQATACQGDRICAGAQLRVGRAPTTSGETLPLSLPLRPGRTQHASNTVDHPETIANAVQIHDLAASPGSGEFRGMRETAG